jgi:hypothetical protein
LPIFAAEKKRKGLSMTTLLSIIGGIAIGLGLGLMSKQEPEKKPWEPKKKSRQKKDDDFWDYAWS